MAGPLNKIRQKDKDGDKDELIGIKKMKMKMKIKIRKLQIQKIQKKMQKDIFLNTSQSITN
uniref:Uncharacterized protein n=1 Tax=Romanomermis culicivorax TaxID=13658 RepID=A0A915JIG1_ROMCU